MDTAVVNSNHWIWMTHDLPLHQLQENDRSLSVLRFISVTISPEIAQTLADSLRHNIQVKTLYFYCCHISPEALNSILQGITTEQKESAVKTLELSGCDIRAPSVRVLAQYLSESEIILFNSKPGPDS